MSKIIFNGSTHQITLYDGDGKTLGTWAAYNNVDRQATVKNHLKDGTYTFQDTSIPTRHPKHPKDDTTDGSYGAYGIFHFNYPGHDGVGVHSGKAHAPFQPGPQHQTMGCIRTSDDAMGIIVTTAKSSPLTTIQVIGNTQISASAATHRHHHRHSLNGMSHG